jgi:hypothetical protein
MTDTASSCRFATREIGGKKKLNPKAILSMIDLRVCASANRPQNRRL